VVLKRYSAGTLRKLQRFLRMPELDLLIQIIQQRTQIRGGQRSGRFWGASLARTG
jgi:hypothetical protein